MYISFPYAIISTLSLYTAGSSYVPSVRMRFCCCLAGDVSSVMEGQLKQDISICMQHHLESITNHMQGPLLVSTHSNVQVHNR